MVNSEPSASSAMEHGQVGPARTMNYFPRWLRHADVSVLEGPVNESGLLTLAGNKVVLGEPGMGKSELMRELGRLLDVQIVTATRFINSKDPAKRVADGKPLLIDGLDEAMSRGEGDAVDAVMSQLEAAGSPRFVLSCRSREWQSRSITKLRQIYAAHTVVFTLEPFDRGDARAYLLSRYSSVDADRVLDHLASHSLDELYCNPLTLGLMGRVAESDAQLPATRASLFKRVCSLVWREHDEDRQDLVLGQLSQDDALDAAGAICAAMLFAGAEAASIAGAAQALDGDMRIADLKGPPRANDVRTIFSSKLFHSVGTSRAKPIHRVIAEYLGALWLTRQATTPRAQRRLMAQFHGGGSVPASLRGLHAWMAYHSPSMAERIITADPYGVLRYGESGTLTPGLAEHLFDRLCSLADEDPYFRAADLDRKTASGLMLPVLKPKIDAMIASSTSSTHLSTLLIEALEGTPLAADLADTLQGILVSPERTLRERISAADALLPHRDRAWWRATIESSIYDGDNNAARLARWVLEHIDAEVSDATFVATMFSEMGATVCPLPRRVERRTRTVHHFGRLLDVLTPERIPAVLDLVSDYAELLSGIKAEIADNCADIVAHLLFRGIDEGAVSPAHARAAWRWLGVIERAHRHQRGIDEKLERLLASCDEMRHAIQAHALENDRRKGSIYSTEYSLRRRLIGLSMQSRDLIRAFERLAQAEIKDPALRQDWKDLVHIGWTSSGLDPHVRAAAEAFRRGDRPLGEFLRKLENPKKQPWEVRQEKEAAKRMLKRAAAFEKSRREFGKSRADMLAGELATIFNPAKAYLDNFNDLSSEKPPGDRLAEWIGSELRDDALAGFEAVLHRTDLPTAAELAIGFASGTFYKFSFPIMAGLYERMRTGRGVADISDDVKRAGLLLCYDDHGWKIEAESAALTAALEADIIPTLEARETFLRMWIEPALAAGKEHVAGLYMLAHDREWQVTGASLAAEWLTRFVDLPQSVEAALVECLTYTASLDLLRNVAVARAGRARRDLEEELLWLAINLLVRFETASTDLEGVACLHPRFIWFLRDLIQLERRGGTLPTTVAQAEWIIAEFRARWRYAVLEGSGSGNTNDYDATDFLISLIGRLADDTTSGAIDALQRLMAGPGDTYSDLIRHMAAEQRQKCAEEHFSPLTPGDLAALLDDGPPGNIEDLKALILEEMDIAQLKLIGDDLDSAAVFWTDDGSIPKDENYCRDRLTALIYPELARYGIQRITEVDMPKGKRADIAFSRASMQLPVEVKGQWHDDVWDAASGQLDVQYLIDWGSERRGIYCVLWFGNLRSDTNRRLKVHPDGLAAPITAEEMRTMLIDRIPVPRRALIDVVVFDLSTGKPKVARK